MAETTYVSSWYAYGSGGQWRLELDITDPPASPGASVSMTAQGFIRTKGTLFDSSNTNEIEINGDDDTNSNVNVSHGSGGARTQVATKTKSVATAYGATTAVTCKIAVSGYEALQARSFTKTVTIPARPYTAPSAPTSVTATRVSDTSITVGWSRNATTGAPYTGQAVRVSIDGAAPVLVANVTGTATSYTYTASPNHKYVFTVVASNTAGSTSSAASNIILTTPNALASLSAAVVTSGTIRLTLPSRPTPYTEAQVVIEETHDGGSTWNAKTTIAMSSLSATTTTTWDDTSAETGGTVQYRAVVETTGGTQGTLTSAIKTSNTLVLNTPPNAPTNLTPSGAVDASNPLRLAWTHNPSSDGAAQSSRQIDYSDDGGSTWTTIVAGNTSVAYYDWSPDLGDFTAGQTIIFRVATAGSQPGTYGAWSASQSLTLYGSLAVTLATDNPPAVHDGGPMPVAWASTQTWGTATQARYQVTMTDQGTGLAVYDTGMVAGADEAHDIPSDVQEDAHTYTVAVTLLDNHQLTSEPATADVTTEYLAPGPVELTWSYDDQTGTLVFYPAPSEESSSALDDTASWTLERSFDGDVWTVVASADGDGPIGDPLARLGVTSLYRSVAYTELGVAGLPTVVEVPAEDVQSRWGWLNYGDGFQVPVRFGWSQTVEISTGRASESYVLEGRDYPGAVFGAALTDKRAVTGKVLSGVNIPASYASASADELARLARRAAVCVFRDPRGAWFQARVSDMKISPARVRTGRPDEAAVSFTIERVSP